MEGETMTSEEWAEQVDGLPVSAVLGAERKNRYGGVAGLDDEELADPDELERQVVREAFAPILSLRRRGRRTSFWPSMDESGGIDWGAFGTVDFERLSPRFNKARYKAERLREELGNVMILVGIVERRLPRAKGQVLKYLRTGVIDGEHLASDDMRGLWRLVQRADRLEREIRELEQAGWNKVRREVMTVLA